MAFRSRTRDATPDGPASTLQALLKPPSRGMASAKTVPAHCTVGFETMSEGFQFLDIIFFAMVAAFILLRLRKVLGRRTGHERRPANPLANGSA